VVWLFASLVLTAWVAAVVWAAGAETGSGGNGRQLEAKRAAPGSGTSGESRSVVPEEAAEATGASYVPAGDRRAEGRGVGVGPEPEPPAGGATNEPGVYDPLGIGAGPGEISATERERAEMAAFHFVDHAYGYSGGGRGEYVGGVNRTVVAPEFWESPGARALGALAERVERDDVERLAALTDFEMKRVDLGRVDGTARFWTDEGKGKKTFEQRLVLRRWGATWRVLYADEAREVP